MLIRRPHSAQHGGKDDPVDTRDAPHAKAMSYKPYASGVVSSLSSAQVKRASRSRLTVALRPPRRSAALACCRRLGVRRITGVCACCPFLPDVHLHNTDVSG